MKRQADGVGKNWLMRFLAANPKVAKAIHLGVCGLARIISKTALYLLKGIDTMDREWLEEHYHKTAAYCKDCGRLLKSSFGEPLGRYFVMDNGGNFYCTKCDVQFEDGDERIYVALEDEE